MAKCFVDFMNGAEGRQTPAGSGRERLDDANFMGRVLVTVLKLSQVVLLNIPPPDCLQHYCTRLSHGPECPARKCKGHLMYHSGVARVAAIQGNDFPLFRGAVGRTSFVIPACASYYITTE